MLSISEIVITSAEDELKSSVNSFQASSFKNNFNSISYCNIFYSRYPFCSVTLHKQIFKKVAKRKITLFWKY